MSLNYFCKICDKQWSGDCWCPECGRVSKVDPKRTSFYVGERPEAEPEKWTKKGARRAAIVRRAKWRARNR